jgi:hypothetical protein
MAIINKTGITNGGTIQAEHVTRTIDALSGVSTDSIIASGSFTGSLTGTASFATSASRAVSASFATTASYALNAIGSGTEYITLTFFHSQVTNTVNGRETYIGGFAAPPNTLGPNRIGLVAPFDGDIIYAAATSYASTGGAATVDTVLFIDGTSITTINQLDLNNVYDIGYIEPGTAVTTGQVVTIGLTETGASSAVWGVNVTVVIKST